MWGDVTLEGETQGCFIGLKLANPGHLKCRKLLLMALSLMSR